MLRYADENAMDIVEEENKYHHRVCGSGKVEEKKELLYKGLLAVFGRCMGGGRLRVLCTEGECVEGQPHVVCFRVAVSSRTWSSRATQRSFVKGRVTPIDVSQSQDRQRRQSPATPTL